MNKTLIIAALLGAISAIDENFVIEYSTATTASKKGNDQEVSDKAAEKAGVTEVKVKKSIKEQLKRDEPKQIEESERSAQKEANSNKEITEVIEQEQKIKVGSAANKSKLTEEERAFKLNEVIEKRVEEAKEESDAAKKADEDKNTEQKKADLIRGREIYTENQQKIADIQNETIREHAAEHAERVNNRQRLQGMDAEDWTANMPDSYLRGYVGLDEAKEENDGEQADDDDDDD